MTGVVSVTTTKRRRYLWCAWWVADPVREPFRKPDAFSGGARSEAEAIAQAERVAGRPLRVIPPVWARAWIRVQAGQAPWVEKKQRKPPEEPPRREASGKKRRYAPSVSDPAACPFEVLGVPKGATADDIRRAFRRLARETHPDQGGDPAAFIRATWARDEALARAGILSGKSGKK